MSMLAVKPARPGMVIYCPDRNYAPLPQMGEIVPRTAFWELQLARGEVVECSHAEFEALLVVLHPHASAPDPKPPGTAKVS